MMSSTNNLASCQICHHLMTSSALKFHARQHAPQSFKCSSGCSEMYFSTVDDLDEHDRFEHAISYTIMSPSRAKRTKIDATFRQDETLTIKTENMTITNENTESELTSAAATPTPTLPMLTEIDAMESVATISEPAVDDRLIQLSPQNFMCQVCFKQTKSRSNMVEHLQRHNPDGQPYACPHCPSMFYSTGHLLDRHRSAVHGEKCQKTCTVCGVVYRTASKLAKHMKFHNPAGREYQCTDGCILMFFYTLRDLEAHRKKRHRKKMPTKCELCQKECHTLARLRKHKRQLHDSKRKPYPCFDGCMKTHFSTTTALEHHQKMVHPEAYKMTLQRAEVRTELELQHKTHPTKPMLLSTKACSVCKIPVNSCRMSEHMKRHDPTNKPFSCTHGCFERYFASAGCLTQHLNRYHQNTVEHKSTPPLIICKICAKSVTTRCALIKHMRVHSAKGRPFQCDKCVQTSFVTAKGLQNHSVAAHRIVKNEGSLPLKSRKYAMTNCEVCCKSLRNTDSKIREHMKMHDKTDRPFQCLAVNCLETYFSTRNALHIHYGQVHATSTTKCKVCGRRPYRGHSMQRHMKLHDATNKPFRCRQGCVKLHFKSSYGLALHTNKVHGKKKINKQAVKKQATTTAEAVQEVSTAIVKQDLPEEFNLDEDEKNRRRKAGIAAMLIALPPDATDEEKLKLIDLNLLCS